MDGWRESQGSSNREVGHPPHPPPELCTASIITWPKAPKMAPACRHEAAPHPRRLVLCFGWRSLVYRRDGEIIALGLGPISQVSANDFATSCHIAACCARQVCARRILPTLCCVRAYLNYLCILHTFHPNCFQTYYFLDGFPSKTLPATFLSFAARRARESRVANV
jgi:hypothetical protein